MARLYFPVADAIDELRRGGASGHSGDGAMDRSKGTGLARRSVYQSSLSSLNPLRATMPFGDHNREERKEHVMAERKTIASAVGRGGLNRAADQQTIRDLLNRVLPQDGGPEGVITEPIIEHRIGPQLQAAIIKFQNKNVAPVFRDGRVDPNGPTLRKLNELARTIFPVDPGEIVVPPRPAAGPAAPAVAQEYAIPDSDARGAECWDGRHRRCHFLSESWTRKINSQPSTSIGQGGISPPLPLPPLSVTTKGPWNPFSTKEPVNVGIFAGPARFTTIGSGSWSQNFLHIPFVGGTNWGVYIKTALLHE
jgi:hypothetical protein